MFVLPPPPVPKPGYLRAAAVQLDFQPSAVCQRIHLLEQPPVPPKDPNWPDWYALKHESSLGALFGWCKKTGQELRKLYCDYQRQRLLEILRMCRAWGVHLVVFPEYSVPPECIDSLLPETQGMVVVCGTHTVEPKHLRAGVYAKFGGTEPTPGTSISPIAIDGAIGSFQPKLNKTYLELEMSLGTTWSPLKVTTPIAITLGIFICLDYLRRDADPCREYVGRKLDDCRLLAVPSLTPHHTISEFTARSMSETKRYGRPVVYANIADGGGTSIFVDSIRDKPHMEFPYSIPQLARYEEGMIVADIDVKDTTPDEKPSRLYSDRLGAMPIAAALFQYATTEEDTHVRAQMARAFGHCDLASCASISDAVVANETELRQLAGRLSQTQQLRLNMLLDKHEQFCDPEEFLCLLRDIPMSDEIDPSPDIDAMRLEVAEQLALAFQTTNDDAGAMATIKRRLSEQRTGGRR
jgi:predicted amidohydrolase